MPAPAHHVDQARRNLDTIAHLLSKDADGARQWAVVVAFYCGLHCVEAYFADRNQHYYRHEDRRNAMATGPTPTPVPIYAAYNLLENQARGARYDMYRFSRREVDHIIRDYLDPIRKFAGIG
jgi:hypothetical protein